RRSSDLPTARRDSTAANRGRSKEVPSSRIIGLSPPVRVYEPVPGLMPVTRRDPAPTRGPRRHPPEPQSRTGPPPDPPPTRPARSGGGAGPGGSSAGPPSGGSTPPAG